MRRETRSDRPRFLAPFLLVTAALACGRIGYDSVELAPDAAAVAAQDGGSAGDTPLPTPDRADAPVIIPDAAAADAAVLAGDTALAIGDTAAVDRPIPQVDVASAEVAADAPRAIDTAPDLAPDTLAIDITPDTLAPDVLAPDALAPDTLAIDTAPDTLAVDTPADAPPGPIFYIGPSGVDTDPGTATRPWKTWSHALAELRPGNTLVALDGDYGVATGAGELYIACGAAATACAGRACRQGSPTQPIRLVAQNERRARARWPMGGTRGSLTVEDCSNWHIDGLHVEGADDAAGAQSVVIVERGQDVVLRRLLVRRNNRYRNSPLINVSFGANVVLEENQLFEGHRNGVTVWYSTNPTVRRTFIYSDDRAGGTTSDLAGGYPSAYQCPDALDTGIDVWGSVGGVVENNVIEGACRGIAIVADSGVPGSPGAGDATRVLGNIGKDNSYQSFSVESRCAGQTPCTADDRFVTGARFEHNVSLGSDVGFDSLGAVLLVVAHHTVVGPTLAGIRLQRSAQNAGLSASAMVSDSLVLGTGPNSGFSVRDHSTWRIDHSNAFMNDVNYDPQDSNVTASLQISPMLGTCRVEIPAGSPMKGAGTSGSDIGATIRYRYELGNLSTTPLWDATTGRFPCGAIVPGVNDETRFPGGSCAEVHARLGVTAGCGRP